MSSEQEQPVSLREEWMALVFVGIIFLALIGGAALIFFGA
jgi:hypothetical protein